MRTPLEQYLSDPRALDKFEIRHDYNRLPTEQQRHVHGVVLTLLSAWYDALVAEYATDFLADLPKDYIEDDARQSLHDMLENAVIYPYNAQQILLCSQNDTTYEDIFSMTASWEAMAIYALEADILDQLERVHSFNWTTGKHKELEHE